MFDNDGYYENALLYQSRLSWIKVSNQVRRVIPYELVTTYAEVQDYMINLESVTEKEYDHLFKFDRIEEYPYEYEKER